MWGLRFRVSTGVGIVGSSPTVMMYLDVVF